MATDILSVLGKVFYFLFGPLFRLFKEKSLPLPEGGVKNNPTLKVMDQDSQPVQNSQVVCGDEHLNISNLTGEVKIPSGWLLETLVVIHLPTKVVLARCRAEKTVTVNVYVIIVPSNYG